MQLIFLLLFMGPIIWVALVIYTCSEKKLAGKRQLIFSVALMFQIFFMFLPYFIYIEALSEAGLQDFVHCTGGQEYCAEFYKLENLQDQLFSRFLYAVWAGNLIWSLLIFINLRPK